MPAPAGEICAMHAQPSHTLNLLLQRLHRRGWRADKLMHNNHRLRQIGCVVGQAISRREVRVVKGRVRRRTIPGDVTRGGIVCVARLLRHNGRGHLEQGRLIGGVGNVPCVEHDCVPTVIVAVNIARVKGRVGVGDDVLVRGAVARVGANLVEPQAVDGDVGRLPFGPRRGRVPGCPFGNVGFHVGCIARAVARVDVAEGLGIGELVDGGKMGGPVAVAAVGDVVRALVYIAVATVVTRWVGCVFGPIVGVDDHVTGKFVRLSWELHIDGTHAGRV